MGPRLDIKFAFLGSILLATIAACQRSASKCGSVDAADSNSQCASKSEDNGSDGQDSGSISAPTLQGGHSAPASSVSAPTAAGSDAPMFAVDDINPPNVSFTLRNISAPADAIAMMVSTSNDFADAPWETIATEKNVIVTAEYSSCGAHAFFLKFKYKSGEESAPGKATAQLVCRVELSMNGVPRGRQRHSAVWTGETGNPKTANKMIIWGGAGECGNPCDDGGIYDLATDTWTYISNPRVRIRDHAAVWTGSKMIMWGGMSWDGLWHDTNWPEVGTQEIYIYDPALDTWEIRNPLGAPEIRWGHVAVWTGEEMIVWGGANQSTSTGGRYNPTTDTWTAMPTQDNPAQNLSQCAGWTGSELIVAGGGTPAAYSRDVSSFTQSEGWKSLGQSPLAIWADGATGIWTGTSLLCFGKTRLDQQATTPLSVTAFDGPSRTWKAYQIPDAEDFNHGYSAVWAGNSAILWGGYNFTIKDTQAIGVRQFFFESY